MMKKLAFTLFCLGWLASISLPGFAWKKDFVTSLGNGAVYVKDDRGVELFEHRSDELFVPASTLKIATAALALEVLGEDYRFKTEFYQTSDNYLAVKGYGDPFIVSEELELMAQNLRKKRLPRFKGIQIDTSFFKPKIVIDGYSRSLNPYDAINGALVANFNTIYVRRLSPYQVVSAEKQTPMTPLAYELAKKVKPGKAERINIGQSNKIAGQYTTELLREFLKKQGVPIGDAIRQHPLGSRVQLIYTHRSSKTVAEVIKSMQEFSTNFIANQLFLVSGAAIQGYPVTLYRAQAVLTDFLKTKVGWHNFHVEEGSGLSRRNRVSAKQMMKLLAYFETYRHLLPVKDGVFYAKTGTLKGVNTYAGYMKMKNGRWAHFVILINDRVPYNYKFKMAKKLYKGLN